MKLAQLLRSSRDSSLTVNQWAEMFGFSYNGLAYNQDAYSSYVGGSNKPQPNECVGQDFRGFVEALYKTNGVVFACMAVRQRVFSEARFQFRQRINGRPGKLFGTKALLPLEVPWQRGTTADLLARMVSDVDLAGNFFGASRDDAIRRLRPDWVTIVNGSRTGSPIDTEVVGYTYQEGGRASGNDIEVLLPEQVAHFAPIPDPCSRFRGMSWLTPIIDEILADKSATRHKRQFFDGGAQLGYVVTMDAEGKMDESAFKRWVKLFKAQHEGLANAYKCLHPETEVALWNGARCSASDVRTGDLVVGWADGRPVPGVVTAVEVQPPSPIVTVVTKRGRVIKTNDRHPFLTTDRGWVDAVDLREGDKLTTGLGWGRPRLQDALTPREAWMIGLLVGDGSFVGHPVVTMANASICDRMSTVAELVKLPVRANAPYDYRVNGVTDLVRALGLNGKRSYEKRVPAAIMTGGHEVVTAFISGLVDSDGHVTDPAKRRTCDMGITSTSYELLRDVQHLLASLGVNASLCSPPSMAVGASGGGFGVARSHDAHRLLVSGNRQAALMAALLDLAHDAKAQRLAEFAQRSSNQDRSRWDRVSAVRVSPPEPTIGIEVAGHHTHVTGGVVTHNTLFLTRGADVKVVGADLKQIDFTKVQGHGETRVCSAAGVPPIVAGVSEGLDAATYSNYAQARRAFADMTLRPLWRNAAASLASIVSVPSGSELWYDDTDIPFLQEDMQDEAKIQQMQAAAIRQLVDSGYTPESVVSAVTAGDLSLLEHSGLYSVQLQPAGSTFTPTAAVTDGANGRRLLAQLLTPQ